MNRNQSFIAVTATLLFAVETLWANAQPVQQTPQVKEKQMYAILFRVVVKPGMRQEFIDFMNWDCQVVKEDEPQTLRFDVLEDPQDKHIFYVYEAYKDQQAFEAHKKNAPFQHWSSTFKNKVVADFKLLFTGRPMCSPAQ
jgi:autoinducer 2-degrading protein